MILDSERSEARICFAMIYGFIFSSVNNFSDENFIPIIKWRIFSESVLDLVGALRRLFILIFLIIGGKNGKIYGENGFFFLFFFLSYIWAFLSFNLIKKKTLKCNTIIVLYNRLKCKFSYFPIYVNTICSAQ